MASAISRPIDRIVHVGLLTSLCVLFSMMGMAGCADPAGCEEIGCPALQVCGAEGVCVPIATGCDGDDDCADGEFCSPSSGRCVSEQERCDRNSAQCPTGQQCDALDGFCRPIGLCNSDADCGTAEQCSRQGNCEPVPCDASLDCGQPGLVCDDGICTTGCALPEAPCPSGQFCRDGDDDIGECITGCNEDRDCNFGFVCDLGTTPALCIAEPPCELDEDCRPDEICRVEQCVQAPCSADADCPDGLICARAQCVGGDCTEDSFSPNHEVADAATIADEIDIANLSRCAGRPDWFELMLEGGEVVEVSMTHEAGEDLDLTLFDETLTPLRVDAGTSPAAALTYQVPANGSRVFLVVDGASLEPVTYQLSVRRALLGACDEDGFEPNSTNSQAFGLTLDEGVPVNLPVTICGEDEDWFRVRDVTAEQGLRVGIEAGDDDPSLAAALYTPSGATYALPIGASFELLRVGASGDALVRLYSPLAREVEADATITTLAPYTCPEAGAYSDVDEALAIDESAMSAHLLCPSASQSWEVDWFRLQSPDAAATLQVRLVTEGAPPLRATLWETSQDPEVAPQLLRAATTNTAGELTLAAAVDPTQPLALRISSEAEVGAIEVSPGYRLVYQY